MKFDMKIIVSGILAIALLISVLSMIGVFNQTDIIIDTENREAKIQQIDVYVVGEIQNPGVYKVNKGIILEELINKVGGFTAKVDPENINLAFKIEENMMIKVLSKTVFEYTGEQGFEVYDEEMAEVNINIKTATIEELCKIPGVGESTAEQIILYRQKNGFEEIEDLMKIPGIKEKKFSSLKDFVYIE